jgi:uncharacterized protein YybS (DUF2232 family)
MSTGRFRTQGLTEGAVLAALVAFFAAVSNYVPLVGIVAVMVAPLPLAILVLRRGLRIAAIAGVASALVAMMIAGPLVGASVLISIAPMGIVLGIGARREWPAPRIIGLAAAVTGITILINLSIVFGGGRLSVPAIATGLARQMEEGLSMAARLYERMGIAKTQIDAMQAPLRLLFEHLSILLPGMIFSGALFAAWMNFEVARRVLARFGYRLIALPPMRTWRLPDLFVWLPLFGLVAAAVGERYAITPLTTIGASAVQLGMFAFIFQGVVVLWVILGNIDFTPREQSIGVAVAVLMSTALPFINVVLLILGILDTSWKIRDRWGSRRAAASGAGS